MELGTKFFFSLSFSAYLILFWLKILPGRGFIFFKFFKFFYYFFRIFIAQVEYEKNSRLKFLTVISGLSHPVLAKNNAGKRFFNFLNFFRNFLAGIEYERNSGVKFCFHFFSLSHPVFGKNNAGKRFYNFLNFFSIFFEIFLPRSSINGIED